MAQEGFMLLDRDIMVRKPKEVEILKLGRRSRYLKEITEKCITITSPAAKRAKP